MLNEGPATTIVLHSTCNLDHTYEVRGGIASYLGVRDLHDDKYDAMKHGTTMSGLRDYWDEHVRKSITVDIFPDQATMLEDIVKDDGRGLGICVYYISIYPTGEYEDEFKTRIPFIYALVTVVVFVCVVVLFLLYDILVERRQRQVVVSAAKSDAMINSLFPAVIRDRLFQSSRRSSRTRQRNLGHKSASGLRGAELPSMHDPGLLLSLTPRSRLTNFLTNASTVGLALNAAYTDDEPIAEMFANTTVVSLERRVSCG